LSRTWRGAKVVEEFLKQRPVLGRRFGIWWIPARVWDILLGYGGEVCNCACDGICPTKSDDDTGRRRIVVKCDVATRVGKERSSIPGLSHVSESMLVCTSKAGQANCDELKAREFTASADASERFPDACHSYAVRDVDNPSQLFELVEELEANGLVCIGVSKKGKMRGEVCPGVRPNLGYLAI